jgi:L-threonylcarbamoyladenylate synthase
MIDQAGKLIRSGGIVAFPTETVYGLGANALDAKAIQKIYAIKGRPSTSPLIVHVNSVNMARELVTEWPEAAERLAAAFWPGPLTLVLPKAATVPVELTAGLGTVGIRMPAHPLALELIEAAGVPIAAPSANLFMELSPTTAGHVRASLGGRVDLILDGGPTTVGIESTVLSLVGGTPLLLRPGMITQGQIEAIVGPIVTTVNIDEAHPSPGLHDRHYAPRTPLHLTRIPPGEGRGIYLHYTVPQAGAHPRMMPADPAHYAAVLYDVLHECDEEGWDWIAVEPPPDTVEWAGIVDRLRRASIR